MTFDARAFPDFIATSSPVAAVTMPVYVGSERDFDIIVIGSGMGGGILADDLADRDARRTGDHKDRKKILLLEAGSYLYPTHVYNCGRVANFKVAEKFGCGNFWQKHKNDSHEYYIHEKPQMNLGGRSIFWSGLIPTLQPWELAFFPDRVRGDLDEAALSEAGRAMNESARLGQTAEMIVSALRATDLNEDFIIEQTPRALHQPYLLADGTPAPDDVLVSTGVFNTAELLINQLGLSSNDNQGRSPHGLNLMLNQYVEDIQRLDDGRLQLVARNTLTGQAEVFRSRIVVLAGGSIESPKLLARSSLGRTLAPGVRALIGRALTDHPTTGKIAEHVTHVGGQPIPRDSLAKIIFYSRGRPGDDRSIKYPFNVEMNVNHEYWHLRENDPSSPEIPIRRDIDPEIDIKFSFGNCLDPDNAILPAPPFGYVPEIVFRNQKWTDHLIRSRLPALANWHTDDKGVFAVLNEVSARIFGAFRRNGEICKPKGLYGQDNLGFGSGTVHHAVGTLRMPARARVGGHFEPDSVVDEDLRVVGTDNLFVCDMSVMPFSSAANPVRTLAALALRLSRHIGSP